MRNWLKSGEGSQKQPVCNLPDGGGGDHGAAVLIDPEPNAKLADGHCVGSNLDVNNKNGRSGAPKNRA